MKKILLSLVLLASSLLVNGVEAQYIKPILGMCINPAGNIIPIAGPLSTMSVQGGYTQEAIILGQDSNGVYHYIACDSNGNISGGGSSSIVASVVPTSYSGTAGPGNVFTYTTPSGTAHQYLGCITLNVKTAGTAGNFLAVFIATLNGVQYSTIGLIQQSVGSTGTGQVCTSLMPDKNTSVIFNISGSGVTGSPSIEYTASIMQLQ